MSAKYPTCQPYIIYGEHPPLLPLPVKNSILQAASWLGFAAAPVVLLAGGNWTNAAHCGSRCRNANNSRSTANTSNGGRGRARIYHPMRQASEKSAVQSSVTDAAPRM
jgi:hypothetical protein